MGRYLNPTADKFRRICQDPMYVDKSELIAYTNAVMNSVRNLTCFTRPRRFGKSYAARMLSAYYTRGDDTRAIFSRLKIAESQQDYLKQRWLTPLPFDAYLNQCDVLFWDMVDFTSNRAGIDHALELLQEALSEDIREQFPQECANITDDSVPQLLQAVSLKTGRKFFIIIDEWDAIFREAPNNQKLQDDCINFLRSLFKSSGSADFVCGAYMTGILPIKRYGTQSALTDFQEFTILKPELLGKFVGFTENEVRELCLRYQADFGKTQRWYDGYKFNRIGHIYSPNSVIMSLLNHRFDSYWTQTASYESLQLYIEMNFDGLRETVLNLLGGQTCQIDPDSFQNDMTTVKNKDQVLTLLAHLGYLAFDAETNEVSIPNEEIRQEFVRAIKNGKHPELIKAISLSDQLLAATLNKDEHTVAQLISSVHLSQSSPRHYHDEEALRSVVILAYLGAVDHYYRFEEFPGGRGFIDILFVPHPGTQKPALLIELKKDHLPSEALAQIKRKVYVQALERFNYHGEVLLIGISYRSDDNRHYCHIESTEI